MIFLLFATTVFIPMLIEAAVSRRNERVLRGMGATEPSGDVYPLMQVVYPVAFVAMLIEGWIRAPRVDVIVAAGFAVFVAAKSLKYWAITVLGERWTFRVLVPPNSTRVVAGPYRMLRHPNYIAVMGELAGAALLVHAFVTGIVALLSFGALIVARIRVEERALGLRND